MINSNLTNTTVLSNYKILKRSTKTEKKKKRKEGRKERKKEKTINNNKTLQYPAFTLPIYW